MASDLGGVGTTSRALDPDGRSAAPRARARTLRMGTQGQWTPRARLAGFAVVGAVAVLAAIRVYAVDPAHPGHYPACPFRWATSLDCPGCGTLRAAHQVLHGHLGEAANYNLFFVVVAPILVVGWLTAVARAAGWRRPLPRVPARMLPAIPILVIAFWVLRNLPLPGCTWLAA
ncbi:DUF2752 domain-containing protein [Frankia sp. AiPs1]|uniref:DUF2752 domain-containing protein n=1 Tax=Frankia sp. AiPa1 TaxID=573492 RepID=UPI00202B6F41|nr:DUF2752 domain-containing protein [Frankia sp. AiPa1]MCL9762443.1 DUF2752 domain-containing protein [Frankia sp. AiPa1]